MDKHGHAKHCWDARLQRDLAQARVPATTLLVGLPRRTTNASLGPSVARHHSRRLTQFIGTLSAFHPVVHIGADLVHSVSCHGELATSLQVSALQPPVLWFELMVARLAEQRGMRPLWLAAGCFLARERWPALCDIPFPQFFWSAFSPAWSCNAAIAAPIPTSGMRVSFSASFLVVLSAAIGG